MVRLGTQDPDVSSTHVGEKFSLINDPSELGFISDGLRLRFCGLQTLPIVPTSPSQNPDWAVLSADSAIAGNVVCVPLGSPGPGVAVLALVQIAHADCPRAKTDGPSLPLWHAGPHDDRCARTAYASGSSAAALVPAMRPKFTISAQFWPNIV